MRKIKGKRTGKTKPKGNWQEIRYIKKNKRFRRPAAGAVVKSLKHKPDLNKLRQKPEGPNNPAQMSKWKRTNTKQRSLEEVL